MGFMYARGWACHKVKCNKCGNVILTSSLKGHVETHQGLYCSSVVPEEYLLLSESTACV